MTTPTNPPVARRAGKPRPRADVSECREAHELYAIRREVERLNERINVFLDSVSPGSAFDRHWSQSTASGRRDLEFLSTALNVTDSSMMCDQFYPPSQRIAALLNALGAAEGEATRERLLARLDKLGARGSHPAGG